MENYMTESRMNKEFSCKLKLFLIDWVLGFQIIDSKYKADYI